MNSMYDFVDDVFVMSVFDLSQLALTIVLTFL